MLATNIGERGIRVHPRLVCARVLNLIGRETRISQFLPSPWAHGRNACYQAASEWPRKRVKCYPLAPVLRTIRPYNPFFYPFCLSFSL